MFTEHELQMLIVDNRAGELKRSATQLSTRAYGLFQSARLATLATASISKI